MKYLIDNLAGLSFIISDIIQLIKLIKSNNISQFEPKTFLLFLFTNITGYLFANNIYHIPTGLAYLGPSLINILIILYTYYRRGKKESFNIFLISIISFLIFYLYFIYSFPHLLDSYGKYFGIIPGIFLPIAYFLQLIKIIKAKNCMGVSLITWTLQLIGNLALYILLSKWTNIIAILSSLVPATICFFILLFCYIYSNNKNHSY